jgi:hypothetical protein
MLLDDLLYTTIPLAPFDGDGALASASIHLGIEPVALRGSVVRHISSAHNRIFAGVQHLWARCPVWLQL